MTRFTLSAMILGWPRNGRARRGVRAGQADGAPPTAGPRACNETLTRLSAAGAPGAILFVRDGNRITRLTAGVSDIARKTPMRPDNHFKIASLTKTYTATVVLQLVGEGKLALDDTVEQQLPGVVPNGSKIGIRQLLNHTSGLADFENDPRLPEALPERELRPLLVAAPARQVRCRSQAAVRAGRRLLVLEHELRHRPADHRKGDRALARRRADSGGSSSRSGSARRATRRSRACRAPTRTATCCSASRP